jgi:hypothetical protein
MAWTCLKPLVTVALALAADPAQPTTEESSSFVQAALEDTTPPDCGLIGSFAAMFPPSDQCFPRFISPVTNVALAKDARSLSRFYPVFINNWLPDDHPTEGGTVQVYGAGLTMALSETLEVGIVKGGYADKHFGNDDDGNGFFSTGMHVKKTLVRDFENQFLLAVGLQLEPQTGQREVFHAHGDGLLTTFVTVAKEWCETDHFLGTIGFQLPADHNENSTFIYTSLHFDRQLCGWVYPFVECNWFAYTRGADRGIPEAFGEGDGLVNVGTDGIGGHSIVTLAVGASILRCDNSELAIAYETPVTPHHDVMDHRLHVKYTLKF